MREFLGANRNQLSLLPASIEDWLPENHLARFVVEAVEELDLRSIYGSYGQRGFRAYDPKLLVGLLFYGYATGVFSSRKLEEASYDSVAFRYICGNLHPDHDTIAHFRKRFLQELEGLFVQILLLAQEMGFGKVGQVNIDGTKIQANASKHHAMSYQRIKELEVQLKAEMARLLALAQEADDSQPELDIPAELSRREERLNRLSEARKVLEERAQQDYEQKKASYDEKMDRREKHQEKTGKKPPGRPPQAPTPEVNPKAQYNFTDEESRIMKTKDGFEQCYNAQAAVTNDMLVVATSLSNQPNDKQQLEPVLKAIPEEAGKVEVATADTGYFSEKNIKLAQSLNINPHIATGRQPHNKWLEKQLDPQAEASLPEYPTPNERMAHKLRTVEGKEIYRQRKMTVEPTFGIIKEIMGFRRFSLRGKEQVQGEWSLVCSAYNLKRLFNLKTQRDKNSGEKSLQSTKKDENGSQNHPNPQNLAIFSLLAALISAVRSHIGRYLASQTSSGNHNIASPRFSPTGC